MVYVFRHFSSRWFVTCNFPIKPSRPKNLTPNSCDLLESYLRKLYLTPSARIPEDWNWVKSPALNAFPMAAASPADNLIADAWASVVHKDPSLPTWILCASYFPSFKDLRTRTDLSFTFFPCFFFFKIRSELTE